MWKRAWGQKHYGKINIEKEDGKLHKRKSYISRYIDRQRWNNQSDDQRIQRWRRKQIWSWNLMMKLLEKWCNGQEKQSLFLSVSISRILHQEDIGFWIAWVVTHNLNNDLQANSQGFISSKRSQNRPLFEYAFREFLRSHMQLHSLHKCEQWLLCHCRRNLYPPYRDCPFSGWFLGDI